MCHTYVYDCHPDTRRPAILHKTAIDVYYCRARAPCDLPPYPTLSSFPLTLFTTSLDLSSSSTEHHPNLTSTHILILRFCHPPVTLTLILPPALLSHSSSSLASLLTTALPHTTRPEVECTNGSICVMDNARYAPRIYYPACNVCFVASCHIYSDL